MIILETIGRVTTTPHCANKVNVQNRAHGPIRRSSISTPAPGSAAAWTITWCLPSGRWTNNQSHPWSNWRAWRSSWCKICWICLDLYNHNNRRLSARLQCLVQPGVRDKRRVSEIDLSQPRHETAFWWLHNGPVTSQLNDPIKWRNYQLEFIGIYVHINTHNKENLTYRCRRSINVQLCSNGKNPLHLNVVDWYLRRMGDYKNPLHLDVVDRYLRRMGDKTIPDEAPPSFLGGLTVVTFVHLLIFDILVSGILCCVCLYAHKSWLNLMDN